MTFSNYYFDFQKNTRFYNVPALFLEVPKCNLNCVFNNERLCNFSDSLDNTNTLISDDDVKKIITDSGIKHIVIQGGEPLLYKTELEKFLNDIWQDDFVITVKTNGSLPILNPLNYNYKIALYDVYLRNSLQPKVGQQIGDIIFGTKECHELKKIAYNVNLLTDLIIYSNDYLINIDYDNLEYVDKLITDIYKTVESDELGKEIIKKRNIKNHIVVAVSDSEQELEILKKQLIAK